jgi:hypothetical protein
LRTRGERHADRADRDERNGQQHGRLASCTISKSADQQPAQRARDEANAKDRYRQHHRDQRFVSRKKVWPIYTAKNA